MTPSIRTLPVISATWDPLRKAFVVVLPGNVALPAPTEWDVSEIVRRHASGASIRWIYPTAAAPSSAPNGAEMSRTALSGASQSGQSGAPLLDGSAGLRDGRRRVDPPSDGAPLLDTAGDQTRSRAG